MATKQIFQRLFAVASLALVVSGCSPSGPGLLLEGAGLIEDGHPQEALTHLEAARDMLAGEARLWNYLGLAYHQLGRATEAQQAYQQALTLDNNLAEARYNRGWLYFEQENHPAALNEFITFVKLRPTSAEGWTRLGIQQVRVKRYEDAEQSLNNALRLQPKNPAANNALGMVQAARRRTREASAQFNEALLQDPAYAPAKLNLGVLALQSGDRAGAAQHLRAGLAMAPNSASAPQFTMALEGLERQLGGEAAPPPTQPAPVAPLVETPAKSNSTAAATNKPIVIVPAKTPTTAGPKVEPASTKSQPAVPMEIVRVSAPPPVKSAGETKPPQPAKTTTSAPQTKSTPAPAASPVVETTTMGTPTTETNRPGFWKRANPVRWFGGGKEEAQAATTTQKAAPAKDTSARPTTVAAVPKTTSTPTFLRYDYSRPTTPSPGSRATSKKYLESGLKLHRAGNISGAATEYLIAVNTDPSHFEANYNLGLASYQAGNFRRSLSAYEQALSIKPTDEDARYNFALALDRAGYPIDAANELQRLLSANDQRTDAHLSVANLYANRLGETAKARKHYRKVLELDPKHPESVAIRYWLAANPG
jgi:tetratricopeptide (TPR) repeat protein